jgi:hypothetical protein
VSRPLRFRCSKCRTTAAGVRDPRLGRVDRVKLVWAQHNAQGVVRVQYECKDCEHVGWSTHREILTKYKEMP